MHLIDRKLSEGNKYEDTLIRLVGHRNIRAE